MIVREKGRQIAKRHSARPECENCEALQQKAKALKQDLATERTARQQSAERADRLEKRVGELEQRVDKLLEGFQETKRIYQKEVDKLTVENRDLKEKVTGLEKTLAWFKKDKFGPRDEGLGEGSVVIELEFNEPGSSQCNEPGCGEAGERDALEANEPRSWRANEPSAGARPKGQQPDSKGHGPTDRSGVPVADTLTLEIPGGCRCSQCGKAYVVLPETDNSSLAEIQILLYLVAYQRLRYAPQCKCKGNKIETAQPPPRLYPGTTVGNSLWVHLAVQKFLFDVPTNRTLKGLSLLGLPLAHGTVVGGFKIINNLLTPLYDKVVEHCQSADLWAGDETTWRVFDAERIKWWLWLFASADAIVYQLDASRSKQVPQEFFEGSAGTLITDRYAAYKSLCEAIKKAWCWVHQRRDILKIFQGVPALKGWAQEWLLEIAELFVLENKRQTLWQQGRAAGFEWLQAQKTVENHVEKLKERWQRELTLPKLHKLQKQALQSLKRHWDGLTIFLSDPRIPLHNNLAERLMRGPVLLRKNSYGSGTEWAGEMAAKFFTIFHTWLINGLDPEALLLDYFNECSKTSGKPPPDVSQFLPWSMSTERKQAFALPKGFKKPG